jgi:hypothetical protein
MSDMTPYTPSTSSSDEYEDVYTSPHSYESTEAFGEVSGEQSVIGADGELNAAGAFRMHKQKPKSRFGWFRRLLPGSGSRGLDARLWDLDQTISAYPDSPSNYVVRGELYLEMGEVELAYADFTKAWTLATEQVESADWGIIAQVMQNRAEAGLAEAQRRMAQRES